MKDIFTPQTIASLIGSAVVIIASAAFGRRYEYVEVIDVDVIEPEEPIEQTEESVEEPTTEQE